ncbi:hypothetical protein HHK36_033357 [Tetracentron sinense]|uniref:Bromo domain-containing protein n=1 Tax=Tetracentron sinense TaxID=13715 RepID=A0A834Y3U0_TETSI|nr:hypothetical protein HHK36_033357 [Tetracentron sinense]
MSNGGHRRSARISALDAWRAQQASGVGEQGNGTRADQDSGSLHLQPPPERKRGRKKIKLRTVDEVVVNSVTKEVEEAIENPKREDHPSNTDQPAIVASAPCMPEKRILELILDILQRRDTHEIFAEPVDPKKVENYYEIIKEPMDFGTMRAKLQEGMYATLEQFEARAIHELAKKVFYALKTDPGNFELEFSVMRRRPGRKPKGEAGGSNIGSRAKLGTNVRTSSMYIDASSISRPCFVNGPSSLRRNSQTCPGSSSSIPYVDSKDYEFFSGSGDGRRYNISEAERRWTYRPWNSFLNENESTASTIINNSKRLTHVDQGGNGYRESLLQFAKELGPMAQMVANRKLHRCQPEDPNCQTPTPNCQVQSPNRQIPAVSAQWESTCLNGAINIPTSRNFLDNFSRCPAVLTNTNDRMDILDSFSGQKAHSSDRIDAHGAFSGEKAHISDIRGIHGAIRGEMARTTDRTDIHRAFRQEMANTSSIMDFRGAVPVRGEKTHTNDTRDIHCSIRGEMAHANDIRDIPCSIRGEMTHTTDRMVHSFRGEMANTSDRRDIHGSFRGEMTHTNDIRDIHCSVRGEKAHTNDIRDIPCSIKGEMAHTNDIRDSPCSIRGKMAHTTDRMVHRAFRGEMANTSDRMHIHSSFRGEMTYSRGRMDIHGAFRGETSQTGDRMDVPDGLKNVMAHQNQNSEIRLGSYFPIAGVGDSNFPAAVIPNMGEEFLTVMMDSGKPDNLAQEAELASEYSQFRLLEFVSRNNGSPVSSSWPSLQAMMTSSLGQVSSMHGLGSHSLGGEDQRMVAKGASYGVSSAQAGQVTGTGWSQHTAVGQQAVFNMPYLQSRLSEMNSEDRDGFVQPELQLGSAREGSLFDALISYERAPTLTHSQQAGPSSRTFVDNQQHSSLDTQQPDLALQL